MRDDPLAYAWDHRYLIGAALLLVVGMGLLALHRPRITRVATAMRRYIRRGRRRWEYGLKDQSGHRIPLGAADTQEQALQRLAEKTRELTPGDPPPQ